eukprot:scpid108137/ scgid22530/ 
MRNLLRKRKERFKMKIAKCPACSRSAQILYEAVHDGSEVTGKLDISKAYPSVDQTGNGFSHFGSCVLSSVHLAEHSALYFMLVHIVSLRTCLPTCPFICPLTRKSTRSFRHLLGV